MTEQVKRHLHFTCISYGGKFQASQNFLSIISYLCLLASKVIGIWLPVISLCVRIIALMRIGCVVLWETEEDFEKALLNCGWELTFDR